MTMENPQHYQPLSAALHPPQLNSPSQPHHRSVENPNGVSSHPLAEEEEEEDEDEDEVQNQVTQEEDEIHGTSHSSPDAHTSNSAVNRSTAMNPPTKRRPGRPKGSKNRRPQETNLKPGMQTFYSYSHPNTTAPQPGNVALPPSFPEVNTQTQQYYEFQWRLLNLCAEFYGAAEELLKSTPPLVPAQCYASSTNKFDPINMLNDARRNCDLLIANPSRLITTPPPPLQPSVPQFPSRAPPPPPTTNPPPNPQVGGQMDTVPIITNPQTFAVPLGGSAPPPQNPATATYGYPAVPGQYPTTPYYQYPMYAGFYPENQLSAHRPPGPGPSTSSISINSPGVLQGTWSPEETERLKKLAEESKSIGASGDYEWDWVIKQWGPERTRHQILLKANSMGLKQSTTRGTKRRRDVEGVDDSADDDTSPAQNPNPGNNASPILTHQQNMSAGGGMGPPTKSMPWPMPTVASTDSSRGIPIAPNRGSSSHSPIPTSKPIARPGQFVFQANGNGRRLSGS